MYNVLHDSLISKNLVSENTEAEIEDDRKMYKFTTKIPTEMNSYRVK